MSAIELLCEIMAQGGKATARMFAARSGFGALSKGNLVRSAGVVQSIACMDCSSPHDAGIVFEGGHYGYYCPELGFVAISRDWIAAIEPDLSILVAGLADTLDCKRRKSTPLQGSTWRVGVLTTEGGDLAIYLHPTLRDEMDAADLATALSQEIRNPFRLILTANGTLPAQNAKTALLSDVVELSPDEGRFFILADPRDIVEAPRNRKGGAPNVHGEALISLITARIRDGVALPGRNEEAKAIRSVLRDQSPDKDLPSLSTINRYLTNFREGGS